MSAALRARTYIGYTDRTASVTTVAKELTLRIEYDAKGNPIYIGSALEGSLEVDPVWLIKSLVWDANNNLLSIQFAEGSSKYNNSWGARASLTYS